MGYLWGRRGGRRGLSRGPGVEARGEHTALCNSTSPACLPNAHRHIAHVSVTRRPNSTHIPIKSSYSLQIYHLLFPQTHISPLIEACSQANVIWGNLPRVPGVGLEAMGSTAVRLPPGVSVSLEQEPRGTAFPPNEQHPGQLLGWRVEKQVCEPATEATSPSLGPHPTPLTNLAPPDSSTRQSDDDPLSGFTLV